MLQRYCFGLSRAAKVEDKSEMNVDGKIALLTEFRDKLMSAGRSDPETRQWINQNSRAVRREMIEAKTFKTYTIGPPPAVGGLIMKNVDPFDVIYDPPYGSSMNSMLIDTIDQTIGVINDPLYQQAADIPVVAATTQETQKGYVFIAMPMAGEHPEYDDVHDAIRQAANNCGLHAERVDEVQSNERITDRLLESIRKAEYVVADLTNAKPNVFYEAGYAYGIGKTPIYIAKEGTHLEFDLKDYPTIFFSSMRQLRDGLEARFRGLAGSSS